MLEGLEAAEENFSVMIRKERLDSNFAAFPNRKVLKRILETQNWKTLGEVVNYISSGHTPYLHDVKSGGDIGFITVECISDLKLHFDRLKSITKEHFENEFKSNRLVKDSVCCTIKRRICKAFPVTKDFGNLAFNQDISFFLPKIEIVNPVYLATYLCSNIGQSFAFRQMTEQMNPYISVGNLKSLPVVILSMSFQKKIAALFEVAQRLSENSNQSYSSAETILLETIGLKDFEPSTDRVNVKSYKESFLATGRLDAEYYQKKYEDIESKILGYKNGADILKNQIEYITTGEYASSYESVGLESVPYIRNNNMKKGHIELDDEYYVNPNNFKTKANIGEILTSRVGTIGLFGVIKAGQENCVYSDNILCFKLKSNYIPEVYAMLFSTVLYKLLLEKLAGGSVQSLITQTSIKELPIPNIEYSIQLKVADLINESFRLKKQSEQLLETAKHAVEIAIEQDEEAAMRHIEQAQRASM